MNYNDEYDGGDIDLLFDNFGPNTEFDLTNDGIVSMADVDELVTNCIGTAYGDANLDFKVDLIDLDIFGANIGSGSTWAQADFNGDGVVDLLDLDILGANFGFMGGSSLSVPEPMSCLLAFVAIAG